MHTRRRKAERVRIDGERGEGSKVSKKERKRGKRADKLVLEISRY